MSSSAQRRPVPGEGEGAPGPWRVRAVGGRHGDPEVLLPQEGTAAWSLDRAFPPRCPSSPRSEVGPCDGPAPVQPAGLGTENALLAPPVPSADHLGQDVRLLPSGEPAPPWAPVLNVERPCLAAQRVGPSVPHLDPLLSLCPSLPWCEPTGLAALKVWLSGRGVQEVRGDSVKAEPALGQAAARWAVSGSCCDLEPTPRAVLSEVLPSALKNVCPTSLNQ